MVKSAFERALEQTLGFEGGFSDVKTDRGGKTNRGITQRLYDAWRRQKKLETRDVRQVTDDEIVAIAREEFWDPCRCSELPAALAIAVFDMAFHSSARDARMALQKALGVKQDGDVGPVTVAAARGSGPEALLAFLKARGAEMQEILIYDPSQVANLEGWVNRLLDQAWKGRP